MQRTATLDILRTLAFSLVCFGSHLEPSPEASGSLLHNLFHGLTTGLVRGGWVGVDLFFVLSGFLVSGLLFREHQTHGKISARNFLLRRGLKIYPSFWLLIGATVLVDFLAGKPRLPATISELLFIQNYGPFLYWHTWSLAVEEHFYLLLLVFLLFISNRGTAQNPFKCIPLVFFAVAIISLAGRMATEITMEFTTKTHHNPTHLRLDGLFFGVLLSYLYHYRPKPFLEFAMRYRFALSCFGILAFLPAFVFPVETPFIHTFGFTLFYLGAGALLVAALSVRLPEASVFRSVAYMGTHSYSIYLWHVPVIIWLLPFLSQALGAHWNWPTYLATYVSATLVAGIGMALLVEIPTLKLRDRWFPSRARTLAMDRQVRTKDVCIPNASLQQVTHD
jgi:peptidoglycan/LPS O-acetylase OafA/YrhL